MPTAERGVSRQKSSKPGRSILPILPGTGKSASPFPASAAPDLRDWFWLARLEGRLVATAWSGTDETTAEIGAYGYVLTDPSARSLGIARALTKVAVGRFWADGGRAMYLGTAEPTAQRVYADHGFRPYNGNV